ncbi:DNA topoisomerase 1-like [Drosophila novamexicana]|uniref:DNA topoisomerase 1-like n=1 Tax=Drosophila novamexicana TaxID=47314 RepID=UPI0011E5EB16|nr:DNA topoisomerase 1-like [Drosophila novamexicana]
MFIDILPKSTESDAAEKPQVGFARARCRFVPAEYRNTQSRWLSRLRPRQSSSSVQIQSCEGSPSKVKWQTLEHNGPLFPGAYERLPENVHFLYDNCPIELTEQAEEVATFYAKVLRTPFVELSEFNENFFEDFRSCLSVEQRLHITSFELCNFEKISQHLEEQQEARSQQDLEEDERYGYCYIDGERLRVKQFRIKPPGLCCPRKGYSLTMGMIRPRVLPEDIMINCDEYADPPAPPPGHRWRQVVHDRSVTWLYSWHDLVSGSSHYVRARIDKSKRYRLPLRNQLETARRLQQHLPSIRREYRQLWSSEHWLVRQRSVALYCIDQLAMSCEVPEQPDKVTLCDLRVENLQLHPRLAGRKNVVRLQARKSNRQRVYRSVCVQPEVFYNLRVFVCGKEPNDLVLEELTTQLLNAHLEYLMDGLTSHIFCICNASQLLEQRLKEIPRKASLTVQLLAYNQALKEVHSFCSNRQRNVAPLPAPKSSRLTRRNCTEEERLLKAISLQTKPLVEATLIYLDPRITISWCLRCKIPISAIYMSSAIRKKLIWATKCTTKHFCF